MQAAARESRPPAASAAALWLSATLALGVHLGVLILWRIAPNVPPLIEVEGDSMEVALVESAPAAPAPETAPEPPKPEPPPPVPEPVPAPPEPQPVAPPKPPEMVLPERKATPAPKPSTAPKPAAKPAARVNPSATPGTAAPGTTASGNGIGRPLGKPVFVVRPAPAYPAESRSAGEQGVVLLRITVNADGRPSAVSVARSSGFPRLDRAAVEGGWRCRVSSAPAGAQFDAPVRFNLRD